MSRLFIWIFDWFERHKTVFYVVLLASVAGCAWMASQISFQENITNFFDSDDDKSIVFDHMAMKDKIVIMLSGEDPERIMESAEVFESHLVELQENGLIESMTAYADEDVLFRCIDFVYEYLPIFLTDSDYGRLLENMSESGIRQTVGQVFEFLTSPSGMVVGDILLRDPLQIGIPIFEKFQKLSPSQSYEIYNGRLFTADLSTMLMFVAPVYGMGDTGHNDLLVSKLEEAAREAEVDGVRVDCIGAPIVAVYNARQIKRDTAITMSLALAVILFVIFLSFRSHRSIPFIIVPPAFGALFALAMIWLVQGEISAIAIGAGTVVLGISLSYSIHIVSHLNHNPSPRDMIAELATPLTIGCFTTLGAFAALLFTSSALLQDMGLFSVFALVGTTLACLVFLPHFLGGLDATAKTKFADKIDRMTGYRYDGNKWLVWPVLAVLFVCLFFYQKVRFDDDMANLNFVPAHIAEAEAQAKDIMGDDSKDIYIVTGQKDLNTALEEYARLNALCQSHVEQGHIERFVNLQDFVISPTEQQKRLDKWNRFWLAHGRQVETWLDEAAQDYGFRRGAFDRFTELIHARYEPCHYTQEEIGQLPVLSEWIEAGASSVSLLSRLTIEAENKAKVYEDIDTLQHAVIMDRGYFSAKMVETTSRDFNYILWVSSLIVFLALLFSYGRIELTLLSFLPMCISWVIILGLMALFDIKFNIVNIILATFIFGIGDDFSIFIMDGLLQAYRNGKRVLDAHKTAIFFSAFTAIVGMGVLIFARHLALQSIALISVLGLSIVVFVSYTIQPMLFRLFISGQAERGGFPYTLLSLLNTLYCFLYFLLGCIMAQIFIVFLRLLPLKREAKKRSFHNMIYGFTRLFLNTMITTRTVRDNPYRETYTKPAVIIANHQSFIDILLLLSTTPKLVMITNGWVWHSPFFGKIVQYADFHHAADGYETLAERLRERVAEGYSIVVFPEGTRSADCSIQRFHKGAFYLAQLLQLDILPMVIYGAGQISSKTQGFYIKSGIVATKTLQRIPYGDRSFGETYQEQAKNYRKWFVEQYREVNGVLGRADNAYFRDALIKNYIYKGPVLEWYMRVKCRMNGYYDKWDRLIPRQGVIADIGCGYGQMSFMLGLLSPERKLLAFDYDGDKIALAAHSFLCKRVNVHFECADMRTMTFPQADVFVFSDCLHYVNSERQRQILTRAVDHLNEGGKLIVCDVDASHQVARAQVEKNEKWSTRILKFNKAVEPLAFVDAAWMQAFAVQHGMSLHTESCGKRGLGTLYILSRNGDEKI